LKIHTAGDKNVIARAVGSGVKIEANKKGGKDNITVIAVVFGTSDLKQ